MSPDASHSGFRLRPAAATDLPDIVRFVRALAEYEREPEAAIATEADFADVLFPRDADPFVWCVLAELDERAEGGSAASAAGVSDVVGMALWWRTFSTWTGKPGLWLEDLFVDPAQRGLGIGKALLLHLADIAHENGWTRFEWTVLDWNTPALEFYRAMGAVPLNEWTTQRVSGDALAALARRA